MATVDVPETTALLKTTETAVSEAVTDTTTATVTPKRAATLTAEAPAEVTTTMLTVATLDTVTSTTKAAPVSEITKTLEDLAKCGTTMAHSSPILSSEATKIRAKQLFSTTVLRDALNVAKLCSNALREAPEKRGEHDDPEVEEPEGDLSASDEGSGVCKSQAEQDSQETGGTRQAWSSHDASALLAKLLHSVSNNPLNYQKFRNNIVNFCSFQDSLDAFNMIISKVVQLCKLYYILRSNRDP